MSHDTVSCSGLGKLVEPGLQAKVSSINLCEIPKPSVP